MKAVNLSFIFVMLAWTQFSWALDDVVISSKIPRQQRELLELDFQRAQNLSFEKSAHELTQKILGVEQLTGQHLSQWLSDRIGYIVEDAPLHRLLRVRRNIFTRHIFGNIIPIEGNQHLLQNSSDFYNQSRAQVVMSHLGVLALMISVSEEQLFEVRVRQGIFQRDLFVPGFMPNDHSIGIAPVLQMGEGHFSEIGMINEDNTSMANSLRRIATLIHEARHGDDFGHTHVICPEGHSYQGLYACDTALDGSYGTGAAYMLEMMRSCRDCSEVDMTQLRLRLLDSISRIIES